MNSRFLKDGSAVDSLEHPIDLVIHTKAPGKWKIIDMETGEEYIGTSVPHPEYTKKLKEKVASGNMGSWKKIRDNE
jgi:hypothetical protein